MELDPGNTPRGGMPLFEVAKALAFDAVIYRGLSWKTFLQNPAELHDEIQFFGPTKKLLFEILRAPEAARQIARSPRTQKLFFF